MRIIKNARPTSLNLHRRRWAARLNGACPEALSTVGYLFPYLPSGTHEKALDVRRQPLSKPDRRQEAETGRKMSLKDAVDFAINENETD